MSVTEIIDELQDAMLYFENIERFSKDIFFQEKLEESKKSYNESKNNKITFENRKILSNVYLEDVKLLREIFKYDFSEWEDFKL